MHLKESFSNTRFVSVAIVFGFIACTARAQEDSIDAFIASRRNAVKAVGRHLKDALLPIPRCRAASRCNISCAIHSCSGTLGEKAQCETETPFARDTEDRKKLCSDSPVSTTGFLLNFEQVVFRVPDGSFESDDNDAPINITNEDVRLDVCALKTKSSEMKSAFDSNDLTAWLYAGTSNKVHMNIPGHLTPRGTPTASTNRLQQCEGYDPTERPWYVRAASGPRDIVFLVDTTPSILSDSAMLKGLNNTLKSLDTRDRFAVVHFDEKNATVIPSRNLSEALYNNSNYNTVWREIDDLTSKGGFPNITKGLEKAFDLLQDAEEDGSTSKCSKFIVLIVGNNDVCFKEDDCGTGQPCAKRCVHDLLKYVDTRQKQFKVPVVITAITETEGDTDNYNDLNRLARTLVCTEESSGAWQSISDADSDDSFLIFNQISAYSLYEEDPEVFFSDLYEDFSDLGEMFTAAFPFYDDSVLLGVAGADITLAEFAKELGGNTDMARKKIDELAAETRDCKLREKRNGCSLQTLRSSRGRDSRCANIVEGNFSCYTFGEDSYIVYDKASSFEAAKNTCELLSPGSTLAIVDTPEKNEFLAGFLSTDGSWIGMRSLDGVNISWVIDDVPFEDQFGFNFSKAFQSKYDLVNEPICVTADRRGVTNNWNLERCSLKRPFVCQITNRSICNTTLTSDTWKGLGINPPSSYCNRVGSVIDDCSDKDALKTANPLCPQKGKNFTNADRICCGLKADPNIYNVDNDNGTVNNDNGTVDNDNGVPIGAIVGGSIGGVVLILVIIVLVRYLITGRHSVEDSRESDSSVVPSPNPSQDVDWENADSINADNADPSPPSLQATLDRISIERKSHQPDVDALGPSNDASSSRIPPSSL